MYITRGISGSGKSTLAKTLAPKENIFSTDDFFMVDGEYRFDPKKLGEYHKKNQQRVEEALKKGISPIVVDNTNTQGWEIKPYVELADKYGYGVELKEPNTPWNKLYFCSSSSNTRFSTSFSLFKKFTTTTSCSCPYR